MSANEAKVAVAEKTLGGFFNRIANNNESLGVIEARMDDLNNRLKGTDSPVGAPTADAPAGTLPRLSDTIGDTAGFISRIDDLLTSLEDIA